MISAGIGGAAGPSNVPNVLREGSILRRISNGVLAAALSMAAALALCAQTGSLEGQRVVALRLLTEAGRVLQENPAGLPLAAEGSYSVESEREALRKLYRTGLYADIRTEVTSVPGGLRVDFIVRPNYFIGVTRIAGLHEPPADARALAAMHLGLGEPFSETALAQAFERLQRTLHDEGLYQAKLARELTPHPDTRQMDITVIVTAGPRARLGTIRINASTEFPESELLERSKLKPGQSVTSHRLDHGAERLRSFLVKRDHLGGRVVLERGNYDPATNTLPLAVQVTAGPKVRVTLEGARISQRQLRNLVPIYEEGSVDLDLLHEGQRSIRDYLERQGYFSSQVSYQVDFDAKTQARQITYTVDRGPRRRLAGISYEGNHYFNEELLSGVVSVRAAAVLSRGLFSPRLLENDEQAIREMYLSNGFLQVKVTAEALENYRGREGDLFVRFHIQEGPQTRVAALQIIGNHVLATDELLSVIGSSPGQAYSEAGVLSDRDNILALYFNEGFAQASFQSDVKNADRPDRVALTYRIIEGPRVIVREVLISGYEHARPGLIRRRIKIKPEQPLRESDIAETERRLYDLGIFTQVQVATQGPTGSLPDKTVLVEVTESKRYTLGYGGGVEMQRLGGTGTSSVGTTLSVSPLGILEFTKTNVGGRAQTLAFKVRASTLQYRGLVSYLIPNLLTSEKFNLLLTGFSDKSRDVRTFSATRYEGSVQVVENYSRTTSLLYRYFYRHVLVDASTLRIAPEQIPLLSQPTKISGFGVTWIHDRRDNAAEPTRGSFNTADLSVASETLGSSASFTRLFVQNSSYHRLSRRFTFARSTQFGMELSLGHTTEQEIPLPERFFAGGGNSIRGFALNQAGPRDPVTGFPIGGLAQLAFNQELRFPLSLPIVGSRNIGGALFYDAGNVFTDVGRITLSPSPPSLTDLNYFSHTVGFGFRYHTPVGPVRLDFGYQLNPARFSVSCTNGSPGCFAGQLVTRLPRFQFFFNIGSIF